MRINQQIRNRYLNRPSRKARLTVSAMFNRLAKSIRKAPSYTPEQRLEADEIIELVPNQQIPPASYCIPFMNQVIITLGANKPQIDHLNEELQALGASVIHYDDADRLLIDILHESVPDTENKDISSVIALIDFWPGRRSVVDFGIKVKSLLPHCRTAIASEYEAQDNLTKVETPPIDAVLRLPLQGCVACRLVYQTV